MDTVSRIPTAFRSRSIQEDLTNGNNSSVGRVTALLVISIGRARFSPFSSRQSRCVVSKTIIICLFETAEFASVFQYAISRITQSFVSIPYPISVGVRVYVKNNIGFVVLLQYFKKRSNSPIDKLREPKKFCNATNSNSVTANTFLNSTPASYIADMTVPPPGWDVSGVELANQTPAPPPQPVKTNAKIASRCLVECIPQVNLSAKPKSQASQQTPFLREEPSKFLAPSPKATMTSARKLNKISFTLNSNNAKSNGALPVSDMTGKCLDEEDDGKSVIVIDLEEEAERERLMAAESSENSISASTRTVASQTDVFLSRPYLKCACGRFTPSVNSARSCSTQTNLWG